MGDHRSVRMQRRQFSRRGYSDDTTTESGVYAIATVAAHWWIAAATIVTTLETSRWLRDRRNCIFYAKWERIHLLEKNQLRSEFGEIKHGLYLKLSQVLRRKLNKWRRFALRYKQPNLMLRGMNKIMIDSCDSSQAIMVSMVENVTFWRWKQTIHLSNGLFPKGVNDGLCDSTSSFSDNM